MPVVQITPVKIVDGQQMAEIDRRTIQDLGLDGQVLMETAGRSLSAWLQQQVPGGRVAFLCGPGNNGGDGLVAARAWTDAGGSAQTFLVSEKLQGDALLNLQRARAWLIPSAPLAGPPVDWSQFDFVVDALFGTGLTRNLTGETASWAESLPADRTLAVDIPSGIHSATGRVLGAAVRARATITFGLPKLGQLLQPGARHCGELLISEIGFPRKFTESEEWAGDWVTATLARSLLPLRRPGSHKRNTGKLLIVAGSARYPGAGILATLGALRGGAGLVYTYAPDQVLARLAAEAIPLRCRRDFLTMDDLRPVQEALEGVDTMVLGPGIGTDPETRELVRHLAESTTLPVVVDADALQSLPEKLSPRAILTPHHGELARLIRANVADIEKDRLSQAVRAARNFNCTVLLKGDPTLVTTAGGRYMVSNQGTPVLAQGGTGDVLSGLIGALMAQGLDSLGAGALGAYLHGSAGKLSGVVSGLGAEALSHWIPQAWTQLAVDKRSPSAYK